MARVRAARHYQKPDAPVRLVALRGKVGLKRDLRQALPHLRDIFDKDRALFLLRHGRVREIVDAVDWHQFRNTLKSVFDRWAKVYEAGAALGARKINGAFHARRRHVRFRKSGNVVELFLAEHDVSDEPRDEHGRWTSGGGGSGGGEESGGASAASAYKESSSSLNDYLRGDRSASSEPMTGVRRGMDDLIAGSTLGADTVLYRGSNYVQYGGSFRDRAFVSTTTSLDVARGFVDPSEPHPTIVVIHAPAGSHGYSYPSDHQHEVVLPRGSRFQTTHVERVGGPNGILMQHVRLR